MTTTIETLAARVTDLEALLSTMPQFRDAITRREMDARLRRERAFATSPAAERNEAIATMTDVEVKQAIGALTEDEKIRVVADATDDLRPRLKSIAGGYAMPDAAPTRLDVLLDVELQRRAGTIPAYVQIVPGPAFRGVQDRDVPVSDADAKRLRDLGLHVLPSRRDSKVLAWQRPAHLGGVWEYSDDQWRAIVSVDFEIAALVSAGALKSEPCTRDQCLGLYRDARLAHFNKTTLTSISGAHGPMWR